MSKTNFDQMTKTIGGLLAFNNFLSTSKDSNVSLDFARRALPNSDMVGILFVMTIDPAKSTAPFASIDNVSYYQDAENEVLFSMHTVFRIGEIKPMGEDHRLFEVDLTLTSDNDPDLRLLTDRIREETYPQDKGWQRLGLLLNKMGQSEKAQQVFELMLEQTTDESEKARIYHLLGWAKDNQGEYEDAIKFYDKALEICKKTHSSTGPNLASCYNNIGSVYFNRKEYEKSLSSHEKALEIRQQSLSSSHPDLAASYNNIGVVYRNMNDHLKAISYYEKALEIKRKSLPPNHPDLSSSYNNMGVVYENMGDYPKARSFFEQAVTIGQHSLPSNHPDLQDYRNSLDRVKNKR